MLINPKNNKDKKMNNCLVYKYRKKREQNQSQNQKQPIKRKNDLLFN